MKVTMNITIPIFRQFFAIFGESFLMAKYPINPPIIPKSIGTRYHHLLSGSGTVDDLLDVEGSILEYAEVPHLGQNLADSTAISKPHLMQKTMLISLSCTILDMRN